MWAGAALTGRTGSRLDGEMTGQRPPARTSGDAERESSLGCVPRKARWGVCHRASLGPLRTGASLLWLGITRGVRARSPGLGGGRGVGRKHFSDQPVPESLEPGESVLLRDVESVGICPHPGEDCFEDALGGPPLGCFPKYRQQYEPAIFLVEQSECLLIATCDPRQEVSADIHQRVVPVGTFRGGCL